VSAGCREARTFLAELSADTLPETQRRAVRGHLAECADCRREALAADPLAAFSRFGAEEVSEAEVARVLEGVRHAVSLRRVESRLVRGRRPSRSAAAAAAAAIAAVLLLPGGPTSTPREAVFPVASPRAEPAEAAIAPARSSSESLESGATVYDWNPGGGEPRVVWIVDRSLDI
jgi:hypothetical protein